MALFVDRRDAGRKLGARLGHLVDQDVVVLGLPRGGMVVAAEVARALDAPLDVLVVRKVPAPSQPELAIGAVTDGKCPQAVMNESIMRALAVPQSYVDRAAAEQLDLVRQRQALYRRDRASVSREGRTVVVVDDGIATGATVEAALQALRREEPAHLVLAVPVAPPDAVRRLEDHVDELITLATPPRFHAVGQFYDDFSATTDEEVVELLHGNGSRQGAGTESPNTR